MILGPAAKQKAGSALERIGEKVEQHAGALMGLLLCLFFVALVGLAARANAASTAQASPIERVADRPARRADGRDVWFTAPPDVGPAKPDY